MGRKVRIGVVGTSWWTDLLYVPSLNSHPGAEMVAICGRDAARAGEVAAKFGGAKVFTDYRQLIGSGDIDAVFVVTPDDLHYEMTMAAVDAGLHVLCEKPLAGNAGHAREKRQRADAAGLKTMVLFTWRWQPHWRYVKQLVETSYIGRCCQARFEFIGGHARDPGYKWRFDGQRANGILGDLGSHMIDFAQWLVGDVAAVSADLRVYSDQSSTADPPPLPVNDAGVLVLDLAGGAQAEIQVGGVALVGDQITRIAVRLYGDAGSIEAGHIFFGADAGVRLRGLGKGEAGFTELAIPAEFFDGGVDPGAMLDPYTKQSAGPRLFIDAILGDRAAVPDFSVGVRVQEVVDAAIRSNAERCWVPVERG